MQKSKQKFTEVVSLVHNDRKCTRCVVPLRLSLYVGNQLDFCDLDLIFKVTASEKQKIHGGGTSVFSENTVTSLFYQLLHDLAW